MTRTLVTGSEAACGVDAANASTFGSATVVRLVNTTSTARVVTVATAVGGTTVGTFTIMRSTSEIVEKQSSHCIFAADAAVLGAKIGYTN